VGVPSMGGVIIIVAILVPCLLLGRLDNIYMILMLITTDLAGWSGLCRRLYQGLQKGQGRPARQIQDYRSGGFGTHCRALPCISVRSVKLSVRISRGRDRTGQGYRHLSCRAKRSRLHKTTIPFFKSNNLDYADLTVLLWQIRTILRGLDTVCARHHIRGNRRFQRCQPERRHGRHGGGQLRHYRSDAGHTGIRIQPLSSMPAT
jgi:hypothetical protein